MSSKEFERNEPNRRSIRLKPNKLEVVTLGELPTSATRRIAHLASPQPSRVAVRNLRNEQNTRHIDIRDGYSLKLSDITTSGSNSASSSSSKVVAKLTDSDAAVVAGDDQSLSVLQNLERQINTMEFDTRMNAERSTDLPETKKERPVHYGELPSLLNSGISDVAGNGFGYMDKPGSDSEEDLQSSSFKRGEDSRSSTAGAITSGSSSAYARKLKTTRIINRTVSDSKNAENTAKLLRQKKPAPRPPMIIPTTSPPHVTKMVAKDATSVVGSSSTASSTTSSMGSSSTATAVASPISSVKNSTEKKISSEIMKHVISPQKSQVMFSRESTPRWVLLTPGG